MPRCERLLFCAVSVALTVLLVSVPPAPTPDFVELPPSMSELVFANVICGVIRGALEMVRMRVEARFTSDMLKGDPVNTIRWVAWEALARGGGWGWGWEVRGERSMQ